VSPAPLRTISRVIRLHVIPPVERYAALASLVAGLGLLGIKFVAYWMTDSPAIFADAVESIVNVMAAVFALWALSIAHTPADEDHPYGHGKAEFLSAGFEGGMILIAAVMILIRTIDLVFFHEIVPGRLDTGVVLLAIAMVINLGLGFVLVRVGKSRRSLTLEADGHHLLSDAVTSVAVLISLFVVLWTGWRWADPLAAALVSVYIAYMGMRLIRQSTAGLMDKQDAHDGQVLVAILDSHVGPGGKEPHICSYHKLRHRHSGRFHWVDFHVLVPRHLDVAAGHHIASEIEHEMEVTLGEGNATAHVEPCDGAGCGRCGQS
jgi:cation diffusion facilitator family transporter